MIKDRFKKNIEKFPIKPTAHIVYIVYNNNMIRAIEDLICEIHGKKYFNDNVTISTLGRSLPTSLKGKRCIVYFDPLLYSHIGNGYN
jgi:hypothetical protein